MPCHTLCTHHGFQNTSLLLRLRDRILPWTPWTLCFFFFLCGVLLRFFTFFLWWRANNAQTAMYRNVFFCAVLRHVSPLCIFAYLQGL